MGAHGYAECRADSRAGDRLETGWLVGRSFRYDITNQIKTMEHIVKGAGARVERMVNCLGACWLVGWLVACRSIDCQLLVSCMLWNTSSSI